MQWLLSSAKQILGDVPMGAAIHDQHSLVGICLGVGRSGLIQAEGLSRASSIVDKRITSVDWHGVWSRSPLSDASERNAVKD